MVLYQRNQIIYIFASWKAGSAASTTRTRNTSPSGETNHHSLTDWRIREVQGTPNRRRRRETRLRDSREYGRRETEGLSNSQCYGWLLLKCYSGRVKRFRMMDSGRLKGATAHYIYIIVVLQSNWVALTNFNFQSLFFLEFHDMILRFVMNSGISFRQFTLLI
jgi:hypothetical protein